MAAWLVVTFISPDRPGLVEQISELVRGHGGNWEESRLGVLAGRFAGILEVTAPEARADALEAALRSTGWPGFVVHVDRGVEESPSVARRLKIVLTGADHEGIVNDVARVLRSAELNIEELESEVVAAPMSGGTLFQATIEVSGPPGLDTERLRRALERLADDLMVELDLHDA